MLDESFRSVPGADAFRSSSAIFLDKVDYSGKELSVRLDGPSGGVEVTFVGVLGYRVLDERDLGFWPGPIHWLLQVCAEGWLSQETSRPGFLSHQIFDEVVEYLVSTESECISVLVDHREPPHVTLVSSNPSLERP